MNKAFAIGFSVSLVILTACSNGDNQEQSKGSVSPAITNRLHIPPEVISNLGITFATVKREKLGSWRELPGRLEVPETRRYVVRVPVRGRIIKVSPLWGTVEKGGTLAELVSPELLAKQHSLVTLFNLLESARAENSPAQQGEKTKLRLSQSERTFRQELNDFSVLTGFSPEELFEQIGGAPRWLKLSSLLIRSPDEGRIVELSASVGEVVEAGAKIAVVYNLNELLFRGALPESYFSELKPGAAIRIQPIGAKDNIQGVVERILPITDEQSRSALLEAVIDNSAAKLPHGVSATAQVRIAGSEYEEAVIPSDCIVQDGLEMVVFKRDSEKQEFAVRLPVEVGARSGGMIEILSGVMEGDEVICNGIHQLKLTGLGKAPQGGHFHADGTWHEGDK